MIVREVNARYLEKSIVLSGMQMAKVIPPVEVIRVLNEAKIKFVLVGAYGTAGWRKESRATEDVDVVVAGKQVKRAVRILTETFPNLDPVDLPAVVRLADRETQDVLIDVMKPLQQPCKEVFKHTHKVTSEGQTYRIPSLEMALVMKFGTMTSIFRAPEDKLRDTSDFMRMVKNNVDLDKEKTAELALLIYPEGGKDILDLIQRTLANEILHL